MPDTLPGWTIKGGAGVPVAVAAESVGIEDFGLSFKSLVSDTAKFGFALADATADPLFPVGTMVEIFKDGARVFLGGVLRDPQAAIKGTSEGHSYLVEGPWAWLENTVFMQSWSIRNPAFGTGDAPATITEKRPIYVLGEDMLGNPLTTGAVIREALEYAVGAGAPFQIGTILAGVYAPTQEGKALSCAEVVKNMLRWTPDAVAWFDYSTTPPTLSIVQRAALTAVSVPMVSDISESLEICARHDLQVPSVTLVYDQNALFGGKVWGGTAVDTWPASSNPQTPKALVLMLELAGQDGTSQSQPVVTRSLPGTGADASTILLWWRKRDAWLASLNIDDLEVIDGSWVGTLDAGQVDANGDNLPAWGLADLPNELVRGSITDWMQAAYTELKAAKMTVAVKLSIDPTSLSVHYTPDQARLIRAWFNMDSPDPLLSNVLWKYASVTATNAVTQVYQVVTSAGGSEPMPPTGEGGLANNFYDALATLHYEGSFSTVEAEVSRWIGLGNTFNLNGAGARAAWATMNAVVQEVDLEAASGRTTIHFGPPEHLSPQDVLELIRGLRRTQPSYRTAERATGAASASAATGGSGWTPGGGTPTTPPSPQSVPNPWQGRDASAYGAGIGLQVWPGRVNGIVPSNATGGHWWSSGAVSGSGSVWAACTVDATSGECTAATLACGVMTGVADSATLLNVELLRYSVSGGVVAVTPVQTTNVNFTRYLTVVNGTLCWSYFFTFERNPVPVPIPS